MKKTTVIVIVVALCVVVAVVFATFHKNSAEKAGQKIDKVVQDTKDIAHDVKQDVTKKR
jgi:cell shape-determining protein MreC